MSTATVRTLPPPSPFGRLLKHWRQQRGTSQLALALDCGISQRHLSFLESGRAGPSRSMVLHLAAALAVPLRHQNALLLAAGFAPAFGERSLDAPALAQIDEALARALAQQEPYPAVVVDRHYTLLRANDATWRLLGALLGPEAVAAVSASGEAPNMVHLLLRPDGLRPYVENWEEIAVWLLRRLRAEALLEGGREDAAALMQSLLALPDVEALTRPQREERDQPPVLVAHFRRGALSLSLFSMIATMGTPLDVALQDLRLELFFPADAATGDWFRAAAAGAAEGET